MNYKPSITKITVSLILGIIIGISIFFNISLCKTQVYRSIDGELYVTTSKSLFGIFPSCFLGNPINSLISISLLILIPLVTISLIYLMYSLLQTKK